LRQYGFKRARSYVLVHDGEAYDSKAIVGVAHGFLPGEEGPLTSSEFSGGEMTVGRLLRRFGFTVQVSDRLAGDDLTELISKLHVRWSAGLPARYQPITLLWAIGRALRGEPRPTIPLPLWPTSGCGSCKPAGAQCRPHMAT
jgi:5-methylcytosine-specific restriction protein A